MIRPRKTIAAARCDSGLSMRQLAARVGVAASTIMRWERGEGAPSWKQMQMIAEAVHTTADYLVQTQTDLGGQEEGTEENQKGKAKNSNRPGGIPEERMKNEALLEAG